MRNKTDIVAALIYYPTNKRPFDITFQYRETVIDPIKGLK